jgi:hypothetical protein
MTETTTLVAAGDEYPDYTYYNKDLVRRLAESTPIKVMLNVLANTATVLAVRIIDPILDTMKEALDSSKAALSAALEVPVAYVFTESGESLSDKDAKARVEHNQAIIHAHKAAGSTIDERTPNWLVIAGKVAPWAEVLGIAVFVTALWNVYWLAPWTDWLTFFTALVLVIGLPVMQKYFAEHAGKAHNAYRLADFEGLDAQALGHKVRRNWYLAGTFMVGTAGMVILAVRGIIALDDPTTWEIAVIAMMAAIVGYGTAILAYSRGAVDGTRYQREVDELTAQGEAHAARWQKHVLSAEADLQQAKNDEEEIVNVKFPKVLEVVRQQPGGDHDEAIFNLVPLIERSRRTLTLSARRVALVMELTDVTTNHRPAFLLNS